VSRWLNELQRSITFLDDCLLFGKATSAEAGKIKEVLSIVMHRGRGLTNGLFILARNVLQM
jgi:hypothetical protein